MKNVSDATLNEIRDLLRASDALKLLYHSHGITTYIDLANTLEQDAHKVWRDAGQKDVSTFTLAQIVE